MRRLAAFLAFGVGCFLCVRDGFALPDAAPVGPSVVGEPRAVAGSRDALPFALRRTETALQIVSCSGWGVPIPGRCDWSRAIELAVPEACVSRAEIRTRPIELFGGGRAERVTLGPANAAESAACDWQAVVVAERRQAPKVPVSLSNAPPVGKPWVVYFGPVTQVAGDAIRLDDVGGGKTQIVVGKHDPDVQLCKRPALLSPRVLDLQEMRLRRVGYLQVSLSEQRSAPRIVGSRTTGGALSIELASSLASSANGAPAFAVDGDMTTRWSEGRRGSGKGEYLVLRALGKVPLSGVSFNLGPEPAPSSLWLQTDSRTYRLEFPTQSASSSAAPREVHFKLPEAVSTGCLALSLNDAAAPDAADVDVGFAEVVAWSALKSDDLTRYIGELNASDSDVSDTAANVLAAHGLPAVKGVAKAYPRLSTSARGRALSLFSRVGCRASPGFAAALASVDHAELERAEQGLAACGSSAANTVSELLVHQLAGKQPAGARRVPRGSAVVSFDQYQTRLLEYLAGREPVALVDLSLPYLGKGKRRRRHLLRDALIDALEDKPARERALSQVQRETLETPGAVALVYALSAWVHEEPRVQARLLALLAGSLNLRYRYLLLTPVSHWLSAGGVPDTRLVTFFRAAMSPNAPLVLRVHATRIAPLGALQTEVVAGLADPEVRVREAAVLNLGQLSGAKLAPKAVSVLETLLREDSWPIVRAETARVLGASALRQELSVGVAEALAEAAGDDASPHVRRPALYALGARRAHGQLPTVREVFRDDDDPHVRAAAATALGVLCDATQVDALHERALVLRDLTSSLSDRVVGRAALSALGRLAPRDLAIRLGPLFGKRVPAVSRLAAEQALEHPNTCSAR